MPRRRARIPAEAGGMQQAHRAQREQLAAARRRLAEPLDGVLEVAGAAFGERQRRVGHAPELHPLLRTRRGDRALEVAARLLGVEALGGARAENRQRRRLVFRLAFELLVGALLERLDRLQAAALLDADLALFGCHRASFYGLPNRRARGQPAPRAGDRVVAALCRRYARRVSRSRQPDPPAQRRAARLARVLALRARVRRRSPRRPAVRGRRRRRRRLQRTQRSGTAEATPTQTTATTAIDEPNRRSQLEKNRPDRARRRRRAAVAIAFVIVRDARSVAPAGDAHAGRGRARRATPPPRCASAARKPRPRAGSASETASAQRLSGGTRTRRRAVRSAACGRAAGRGEAAAVRAATRRAGRGRRSGRARVGIQRARGQRACVAAVLFGLVRAARAHASPRRRGTGSTASAPRSGA